MKQSPSQTARVALVHLGCARNLIDSELILARMAERGLVITDDPSQAHTVVLNTCSFIGPAREESEAVLGELLALKAAGDVRAVVVAGCLVQRYKEALAQRFPEVDLFAEISDYSALADSIRGLVDGEDVESYIRAEAQDGQQREGARLLATPASYAYLRISHGCDHTCAFCAIPSIRGAHRSKRPGAVLEEARELIATGTRELVLVAEDSTAWGRETGRDLADLVEALADLEGEHQLRVMYAYPNRFPWRLTELLRDHPRVIPYLDIPIQHLATPVLRAMGRSGSGDAVRRTLLRLREEVPGITLRTTLLMGFPGETDADAAEVTKFVSEAGISRLGAFIYSPEEGTPAWDLPDRVPAPMAQARFDALMEVRDEVLLRVQKSQIGVPQEVLVDEIRPGAEGAPAQALTRGVADAPEVDMISSVELPTDQHFAVGQRLMVTPRDLDTEGNLLCVLTEGEC
ncbi:MAG: 30S ribosomal protein S12 methylthiotransferase RimO [Planctomycetota bacterium]|nr:30S ribosomal protein S12 methylthiotransferase RimO [Planctomycetota bacterium]MDP6838335.1 30S ribosomal protein S12 methylthiotransferase RimO [Planctomycetota bacterium]MDP6954561.1 30S ribosomal protein S12 methylthiotransferase RimO [Planctomycetota bacterium]